MGENRCRKSVVLDCDHGRRLGCESFCCRLIVQLRSGESYPEDGADPRKHCVDKDPNDGLCVFFDRQTSRCKTWDRRPQACREFDCNKSDLLGIVLRDGFKDLARLVTAEPCTKAELVAAIPSLDD
jgi:hypothetical protein